MASDKNDLVFDPFGESRATYAVAEIKNRKWVGVEIGLVDDSVDRIQRIKNDLNYLDKFRHDPICLFTNKDLIKRNTEGRWTPDSVGKEAETTKPSTI